MHIDDQTESIKQDPMMMMNNTPAMAKANIVLPHPGGPCSRTPRGDLMMNTYEDPHVPLVGFAPKC